MILIFRIYFFIADELPFFACPKKGSERKGTSQGRSVVIVLTLQLTEAVSAGKLRVPLSGAGEPVIRDGLFCLLSKNFHHASDLLKCLD